MNTKPVTVRNGHCMAALVLALASLAGCGGSSSSDNNSDGATPATAQPAGEVALLFLGNSHTHLHDMPGLVSRLVAAARPTSNVVAATAPGSMFLDERWLDPPSREAFASRAWSSVVLQAQRYSSSGTVDYSTVEAQSWVRSVNEAKAMPVMFPEWPRLGIDETTRIHALHVSIAQAQPACVAPVPQAFDLAATLGVTVPLHESDGNHASAAGALLAAYVLAGTMIGAAPRDAPNLDGVGVDDATQALLKEAAARAIEAEPPWRWCPGAPLVGSSEPRHRTP